MKHIRWRNLLTGLLLALLVSAAIFTSLASWKGFPPPWDSRTLLNPLQGVFLALSPAPAPEPQTHSFSAPEVRALVTTIRENNDVAPLDTHVTLEKFARLLTLDIEDQETLTLENTEDILLTITAKPPQKVEILSVFAPEYGNFDLATHIASESVILDETFTAIGVHTRSATLKSAPGTIITIALSTDFPENVAAEPQKMPTQNSAPPTFTGEDLWAAVQNYRRAHDLPEFAMSTELCTVASIRLNEQLALGTLDNHDGFDARATQFFEDNPGWTSINENLAAGYKNAVQTVEWGWDQSLGHKALIQSRDYPKACTAANRGFAVLITGK